MHDISNDTLHMISRVYDAPLSPSIWPEIIDEVANHLNAIGSTLFYSDVNNPEINPVATCWSDFWRSHHLSQYLSEVASDEPSGHMLLNRKPREIMTSENISREERMSISEFLLKVKSLFGIEGLVASRLTDSGNWFDYITLQYDTNHGPIKRKELRQLEILLPHLSKSLEISRPMILLEHRFNKVLDSLNHFHIGVIILSEKNHHIASNDVAKHIIALSDGLSFDKQGKIFATHCDTNKTLQQLIKQTTKTAHSNGNSCGSLLRINRRSAKDAFLVEVAPLSDTKNQIDSVLGGSILFLIDPDNPGHVSLKGLIELYGLTVTEADICQHITDGYSNREIAEIRNVSPETIKTQVISLFRKTKVMNRAELIRKALSIKLPIDNNTLL